MMKSKFNPGKRQKMKVLHEFPSKAVFSEWNLKLTKAK